MKVDLWRGRAGTLRAMAALLGARLLIAIVPFHRWKNRLGGVRSSRLSNRPSEDELADSRRLARQVERAAERMPLVTKCLPRAMALSWILRAKELPHAVVIAVRPAERRGNADALHAWVEVGGEKLIGDLPGPWLETLRLGG